VLAVKQLRQTCEELEAGNNRLMLASDIYSRPVDPQPAFEQQQQQQQHFMEERSAIEYTIRNGPSAHSRAHDQQKHQQGGGNHNPKYPHPGDNNNPQHQQPKQPTKPSAGTFHSSRPAPPGRTLRDDSSNSNAGGGHVFL
jgi:hypothetical protein